MFLKALFSGRALPFPSKFPAPVLAPQYALNGQSEERVFQNQGSIPQRSSCFTSLLTLAIKSRPYHCGINPTPLTNQILPPFPLELVMCHQSETLYIKPFPKALCISCSSQI